MPKELIYLSQRQLRRRVHKSVAATLNKLRNSEPKQTPVISHSLINKDTSCLISSPEVSENNQPVPIPQLKPIEVKLDTWTVSESDSTENEESENESELLCDELKLWSNKNLISQSATGDLLKILRKHKCFESLPADARTLKGTCRNFEVKEIPPGQYVHLGLGNGIKSFIRNFCENKVPKSIELLVNIDGIPISKSSKSDLWPILCCVRGGDFSFVPKPFAVGIFHGPGKPKDQNVFLSEFVTEAKELITNGLVVDGRKICVIIFGFICDAPARAFITCTKYHSGFSACSKCKQVGERYDNRVIFSSSCHQPRQDRDFHLCDDDDDDHHRGKTILSDLGVGLVSRVPYEFMHLICLGATRKLLKLWTTGKPKYLKLSGKVMNDITCALIKQQKYVPSDFNRRPRELNELARWKATEYRLFILYVGPVVLEKQIPNKYYEHFLALHLAVLIFTNTGLILKYGDYANTLLQYFVRNFATLYGKENLSYNIHGLLHVHDDVKIFGNLNEYSAFCFENYLGQVKNLVKSGNRPLAQVCRRLLEREAQSQKKQGSQVNKGPSSTNKIITVNFKNSFLKADGRNCFCKLRSGQLIKITQITKTEGGEILLVGKECIDLQSFYTKPCNSIDLGVVSFSNFDSPRGWDFKELEEKYFVLLRQDNTFVGFPLHID
ncbi:uncharacterized protein LOC118436418 isoform X1 [Folsomia candida]|uniref:uncharacterized protein LOC118436418 isoform X1 n=1 Tax=Folsomia candida TaxID=158441 RepID=UPI001604AB01|nr:uncharacterized protein LOC118436418 isoform X1 [Folsomia candida]XP_035710412.1 uncharacterized protein LOC118436418 isoform X1 [Folsomia candida]